MRLTATFLGRFRAKINSVETLYKKKLKILVLLGQKSFFHQRNGHEYVSIFKRNKKALKSGWEKNKFRVRVHFMQKDRQNMRHYERNVLYNGRPIDLRLISSVSVLFRTLVRLNSDTFVRLRTLSYRVRLSSIGLFKFRTLPFNFGPFHPILTSDSSVRFQTLPLDFEQSRPISTDSINFGYFRPVSDAGTV